MPVEMFFPLLRTVFELMMSSDELLMSFSASDVFLFHLFHLSKTFPFEDLFILGWGVTQGEIE